MVGKFLANFFRDADDGLVTNCFRISCANLLEPMNSFFFSKYTCNAKWTKKISLSRLINANTAFSIDMLFAICKSKLF
jgi:hypothetical protein